MIAGYTQYHHRRSPGSRDNPNPILTPLFLFYSVNGPLGLIRSKHTPPLSSSSRQAGRQAGQDPGRRSSSKDGPQVLTRSTGQASPWQPPGGRRCPSGCRRRASAGGDHPGRSSPGPHSSHPAGNFRRAADVHQAAAVVPPAAAIIPGTSFQVLIAHTLQAISGEAQMSISLPASCLRRR